MVEEDEFERRVNYWFALVMGALGDNVHCLLSEGKVFTPDDLDNPAFAKAMHKAAAYQAKYLPDEVLAYYLDPAMPAGYFQNTSRLEFLLQQGLLQKMAHIRALQCIERAMHRV